MRKRYVYAMLFGLPGLGVAAVVSVGLVAGTTGFLWLYVFGDDAWPSSVSAVLSALFVSGFVIAWSLSLALGFFVGKRLEGTPGVDPRHVAASGAFAAVLILGIVLHQRSIGNLGPKSESALCSDFCSARGYVASGMPPRDSGSRTCICFDGRGAEALNVPLEQITADELAPDTGRSASPIE